MTVTAAPATRTPNAPSTNQIKKGLHPEMTDQPTDIDQTSDDLRHPFIATYEKLNALIAEGVKPRTKAIVQAAQLTGVDPSEFRKHFRELDKTTRPEPTERPEKGPRFNPKLNDEAQRALTDLATLNGLGFAPTVAEITVGATDYAAETASRWVVQQYQKATAGLKKLDQ